MFTPETLDTALIIFDKAEMPAGVDMLLFTTALVMFVITLFANV
ncbi:hypothetical protein OMAG_000833 [Candidatus Omnitrophus magneticus]|uniref:Uncharacterized protein n=1 Tax=Candidatus Omnitrophus magneticus TaxID=1609969 RepID=A0A0F0CPP9_9BACT|nr:hypothetical protein OMAG_000833 [Candidatus Omnitrophus magneticus]